MTERYTVEIIDEGRSGRIRYAEGAGHAHEFWWEFGAGEAVILIRVPTPMEWPAAVPWAAERRAEILARLGAEVRRQRCPACRLHLSDAWLELLEPPPAAPAP